MCVPSLSRLVSASCRGLFQAICEGSGDVVGVLTLLVGGAAQAFHDDRVVELRVQLEVKEVDGEGQEGTGRSRKGEASQIGAPIDMTVDDKVFAQDLSQ